MGEPGHTADSRWMRRAWRRAATTRGSMTAASDITDAVRHLAEAVAALESAKQQVTSELRGALTLAAADAQGAARRADRVSKLLRGGKAV